MHDDIEHLGFWENPSIIKVVYNFPDVPPCTIYWNRKAYIEYKEACKEYDKERAEKLFFAHKDQIIIDKHYGKEDE